MRMLRDEVPIHFEGTRLGRTQCRWKGMSLLGFGCAPQLFLLKLFSFATVGNCTIPGPRLPCSSPRSSFYFLCNNWTWRNFQALLTSVLMKTESHIPCWWSCFHSFMLNESETPNEMPPMKWRGEIWLRCGILLPSMLLWMEASWAKAKEWLILLQLFDFKWYVMFSCKIQLTKKQDLT